MKLLVVSDFNIPSGYQTICENLCSYFVAQGHECLVLGTGYDGRQIDYNFGVIPTDIAFAPQTIIALNNELHFDWFLMLMDVEKSLSFCKNINLHVSDFFSENKVAFIFPVEAEPFARNWADEIVKYARRLFTFTEFAHSVLAEAGVAATTIGVGLDPFWYDETRIDYKYALGDDYILTVADNQIRKNLPAGLEMFVEYISRHESSSYIIVTRLNNKSGWLLDELIDRYGLSGTVALLDANNVSREQLKGLYVKARCLLLPSLAEGIGLPLYEAQSQGCPVVATNCGNIAEAVADNRFLIPVRNRTTYTWGNCVYSWPDEMAGANLIDKAVESPRTKGIYLPWTKSAETILDCLRKEE